MTPADTIVAIATPPGRGAIGIVRVSGPAAPRVGAELLGTLPPPRVATLATFRAGDGTAIDEGLALYFPEPASFTGEAMLELQGHGGAVVLDQVLRRIAELGCRQARPGEFSARAFANGKLDVAQAEAVADLIDAGSAAAARAAVRSLQGEFSARVQALQTALTDLRMHVEAAIDFPEEDLEFLAAGDVALRLQRVFASFASLQAAARQGALLAEGLNVVIAGKPNAGKSSLMNALAGSDVAIVTELPGTTRDVLRERVHLDGMPLHLIDTAGLREAGDAIEAEGIRRAKQEILRADRVLYVVDASAMGKGHPVGAPQPADLAAELAALPAGVPVTLVLNKIDLLGAAPQADAGSDPARLSISVKTGQGLDALRAHLQSTAGYLPAGGGVLSARRRHLDALARAEAGVRRAAEVLQAQGGAELFAEDLRLAQLELGKITGEFTSEDLLGKIFGSFCIGK